MQSWEASDLQAGPVPLWFQIGERLRVAIETGEFGPGDRVPPESALIHRFGVSRTTARAALDYLAHGGLVERRQGRGSVVLPPRVDQPLNLLASFQEDMKARGLVPSYRTRRVVRRSAPTEATTALELGRDERVVLVDRLLCADDSALAISRSWLHPAVLQGRKPTTSELDAGSLYAWLEANCGVRIARGDQYIEAATANAKDAADLEIPVGAPVLVARRLSKSASGHPVEYVVLRYQADRYRFRVEMVRP